MHACIYFSSFIIYDIFALIHIENPTRCHSVLNFISYSYEAQHVWGDIPPVIRSLKLH